MYKLGLVILMIAFMGCSSKTQYNAVICKELKKDPNEILPKECKTYDEVEATKAFNKVQDEKKVSDKDIIEYKKEK